MTTNNKKKKATNSYQAYIHKVLKKVHPDCQISGDAISQFDDLIKMLAKTLSSTARNACFNANKSTVGPREIEIAAKLYFPGSLRTKVISRMENSIKKFESSAGVKKTKSKPTRRETRAGLLFSVSLSEKFIRDFGHSNLNVSKHANIALAAILEEVSTHILSGAGDKILSGKKVTLNIRCIYLTIHEDTELSFLINNLDIEFVGGGVMPYINPSLIPTKEEKAKQAARRKKTTGNAKKDGHKFLPGTKSLMEIKKAQKSTNMEMRKLPFDKKIREMVSEMNDGAEVKFEAGTIITLQKIVEQKITSLCSVATDLAVHGKRDGVNGSDIHLAWRLTQSNIPPSNGDSLDIGNNGIERLAFRGGVKRKNSDMYDAIKEYAYSLVRLILYKTLLFVRHRRVGTIGSRDIKNSLETMNMRITISEKKK